MKFSMDSRIADIAKSRRGRTLAERYTPHWERYPNARDLTPGAYPRACPVADGVTMEQMEEFLRVLNAPSECTTPELMAGVSLDELDNASYFKDGKIAAGPLDGEAVECALEKRAAAPAAPRRALSLDGTWQLAFDRDGQPDWSKSMDAPVPGSIHTALVNAGVTPDTTFGRNQELARKYSYMGWWLRRRFTVEDPSAV